MPELPEVETVVRDLRPLLIGRTILDVEKTPEAMRRSMRCPWKMVLKNRSFLDVSRRGKWIVQHLDDGSFFLVHLGMTGQLQVHPKGDWQTDHIHMVLALDNKKDWMFRDIRRFGNVQLLSNKEKLEAFWAAQKLGPEPFGVDPSYWAKRLQGTYRNLKALLLDQTLVAGVGNIYADEALHRARLHPEARGHDLSAKQRDTLRFAIEEVLTEAIGNRGSTIRDYVGGSGLEGTQQANLRVYGRTGEHCFSCGKTIERMDLAGRSTHYCPKCQTGKPRLPIGS